MSDVKRYDCTNGGARYCQGCYTMTETPLGDYVSSEDYDALKAEAQALREEVAALRARVAVVPDASTVYAALDARERLFTSIVDEGAEFAFHAYDKDEMDKALQQAGIEVK